jgi:D-galactose 1-dehydrogenase
MSSTKSPIRLAIVVGKIVRDQHLPALARDENYRLVAAAMFETSTAPSARH